MTSSKKGHGHQNGSRTRGGLFLIGGNEDPDEDKLEVLPAMLKRAGGAQARVIVCGTPSEDPRDKERTYRRLFEKIGVAEVFETGIRERPDAESPELMEAVERATLVFFTGGDQLRLTSLVAGTSFGRRVRARVWEEGVYVAGTSAGAAAMGSTMLVSGPNDGMVRRADVQTAPGLGFWRDTVVDTHFSQRGRVSRLLTLFAQNPQIIGIGLDENTGIDVTPGEGFTMVGAGAAFVFDGRVSHSNAAEVNDDQILALTDCFLHVLPAGYSFNLKAKRPVLPDGREVPARS